MLIIRTYFIIILLFNVLSTNIKDKTIFISPLKIPLSLSSNFGELRIDHFHSGLDIKTQTVTGKEVVATADGYVYRIGVAPGGYGRSLFIRHPSGYSTVYGHLERFTPEIEDYVIDQQYEKQSFTVALFPPPDKFVFKQGQIIAYSGNSGSSGGPHLHYEIRKSDSEIPLNPLLFEFDIEDNIEPVIEKLSIYPVNQNSLINNQHSTKKINVTGGHGKYIISPDNEISISGLAGFGVKTFDLMNDNNSKFAVYSIELKIDSSTIFKYVMDAFSFYDSRYVNSHIDYETYMKENTYFERAFILPNDKLGNYSEVVNRGIYNFNDNKTHKAEIIVRDIKNNKSSLTFNVKAESGKTRYSRESEDKNLRLMPFNSNNKFTADNISVNIPEEALYDTIYFSYKKTAGTREMLSDLHYVHNIFTPVQTAFSLSIKPGKMPASGKSKMLIVQLGEDQKKNPLRSSWVDGSLTAESLSFGRFYIGMDTVPPVISPIGLTSGSDLTGSKTIRITITDDLSGIKSYEPSIDGKWALFEYDQKNNLLVYRFDPKRISPGKKHNLFLKVTDMMDNTSIYKCDFIW
jgi:Peptidase family M23